MVQAESNETLAWSITGGVDAALFSINSISGAFSFIEAPLFSDPQDANANNVYELEVTVTDINGSDSLALSVTVLETEYIHAGFNSVSDLDGEFIILDPPSDTTGAGSGGTAMPGPPVEWNPTGPASNYDWSFFTVAVNGSGQTRYCGRGATLISPSYAVCAHHARGSGTGYYFLQPDGTEISRSSTLTDDVDYWLVEDPGDLGLVKFNSPITTIAPIPILADCSVASGKPCVAIEMDRHLNVMAVNPGIANEYSNWTVSRHDGADALEGGDSGKPAVCIVNGSPVLIITAFESASQTGDTQTGAGPNASAWISEISAILAADGEELTLLNLWFSAPGDSIASAIHTPTSPPLVLLGA